MQKLISVLANRYSTYIFFIVFFVYSLWKFYPAFELGVSVSSPSGDGLGTIAWMSEVVEKIYQEGYSYLLSDLTRLDMAGLGVFPPAPINIVQKVIVFVLSFFTELDNIYDAYAFIGFFLVGVTSFLLLREFNISFFMAVFGALLLANNDNMFARLGGHLTLAIHFAPILLLYTVIIASKEPTIRNLLLVAIAMVFNFSMNEYYGYYGTFFSLFLFVGMYFYFNPYTDIRRTYNLKQLAKSILFAFFVFILLMSLFYPNLIGLKITSLFIPLEMEPGVSNPVVRNYGEFLAYSVKNPWYLFYPNVEFFQNILNLSFFTKNTFYEQSFRVGIIAPVFLCLFAFTLLVTSANKVVYRKEVFLFIYAIPAFLIIYLLANDPRHGASLVNFTFSISEVFRVSSRAYLYVFVFFIVLYIFYLDMALRKLYDFALSRGQKRKFLWLTVWFLLTFLMVVSSLKDTTNGAWKKQIHTFALPQVEIYEYLATLDKGLVVEIPFYHYPNDVFEKGYIYNYNRAIYQSRLLNAILPQHNEFYRRFGYLHGMLKQPMEETIPVLKELGVKYLVLNGDNAAWNKFAQEKLSLLEVKDGRFLYQIEGVENIPSREVLKKINDLSIPTLIKNEIVYFNTPKSKQYLKKGFSDTEAWGTWSSGKEAVIDFKVSEGGTRFLEVEFQIFGNGQYKQRIEFILNGVKVEEIYMLHTGRNTIKLPILNALQKGNELLIRIPTAISPKELGLGSDLRQLGVGLISLKLI